MSEMQTIIRHSYSALTNFETCPRKYKGRYLDNIPEDYGQAAKDGNRAHEAIEQLFKSNIPLPAEFSPYRGITDKYKKLAANSERCLPEFKMAVDYNKQPCAWDRETCWIRGIADLVLIRGTTAVVLDWKTGKPKEMRDQIMLMGLLLMEHMPSINTIYGYLIFLRYNHSSKLVMFRPSKDGLWDKWEQRYNKLAEAYQHNNFPPKPNGLCNGWCAVTSCEHWREKR